MWCDFYQRGWEGGSIFSLFQRRRKHCAPYDMDGRGVGGGVSDLRVLLRWIGGGRVFFSTGSTKFQN